MSEPDRVECPQCRRSGIVEAPCWRCDGNGRVPVAGEDASWPCPTCLGSNVDRHVCPRCNGVGVL